MQGVFTVSEVVVATGVSTVLAETLTLDNLWTALITFGVSLVTIVGGEIIKFLVAYFKNKTEKLTKNEEEKK